MYREVETRSREKDVRVDRGLLYLCERANSIVYGGYQFLRRAIAHARSLLMFEVGENVYGCEVCWVAYVRGMVGLIIDALWRITVLANTRVCFVS